MTPQGAVSSLGMHFTKGLPLRAQLLFEGVEKACQLTGRGRARLRVSWGILRYLMLSQGLADGQRCFLHLPIEQPLALAKIDGDHLRNKAAPSQATTKIRMSRNTPSQPVCECPGTLGMPVVMGG